MSGAEAGAGPELPPRAHRWLELFVELCGLRPDESVLDIGCGPGTIALSLGSYLGPEARYEGFDVHREHVERAQKRVGARHPNFRFQWSDVYSSWYNPDSKTAAREYMFPFRDGEFDFAFLLSVFTHMLPEDVEHYLHEIARVLRPGGRMLATFLLLNEESEALLAETASERHDPAPNANEARFSHDRGDYRITSPNVPEVAVAIREDAVVGMLGRAGFGVRRPLRYGRWPGRDEYTLNQDIIVADLLP